MKRKGKVFGFMLLFFCMFLLAVMPASAKKSGRRYQLKISDIRVSSRNLKPGDTCRISMKIVNEGRKKIERVGIEYASPSTQSYYLHLKHKKGSQRWFGSFKVEEGMQKGLWRIWSICIDRVIGDEGGWYSYYNRYFINDQYNPSGKELSKGNIRIYGTKGDYTKPEVHLDTLSMTKSDVTRKGGKITCRVKITDESSISRVVWTLEGPTTGEQFPHMENEIEMKYNKKTGYYEASVWMPKGTYLLGKIAAWDVFDNAALHFNQEKAAFFTHMKKYSGRADFSKYRVDL